MILASGRARWPALVAALLVLGAAPLLAGCGSADEPDRAPSEQAGRDPGDPSARGTDRSPSGAGADGAQAGGDTELAEASCDPGLGNCAVASGSIIAIERVDPDGDGDAHFVLTSSESITGPGISVIDVAAELRPRPLPAIGDRVSAAGPVYEGSYGQRQIQATELNVAPG